MTPMTRILPERNPKTIRENQRNPRHPRGKALAFEL
jgi:hypothetical protein